MSKVEQRVCLFYVADRVKTILSKSKTEEQLRDNLQEFEDECVHNIGVNALIKRYEYSPKPKKPKKPSKFANRVELH